MSWLLVVVGVVVIFFLIGKLGSKPGGATDEGWSVSSSQGVITYKTPRDKYLPWSEEPYHHTHLFKLYGTDAGLGWNDGDDMVDVWCISRFSKGKPQTKVYSHYYYGFKEKVWHNPPKGAANECLREIKQVLKLK